MIRPLHIGMIGCGFMGRAHTDACKREEFASRRHVIGCCASGWGAEILPPGELYE